MIEYILLIGLVIVLFFLYRINERLSKKTESDGQVDALVKSMDGINERLDNSAKELGKMTVVGRQVQDFQKEFEMYFSHPKFRGNLGEVILKDMVSKILPKKHYFFQHRFKTGSVVDVLVKTSRGDLPIDSKFPLESYKRLEKGSLDDTDAKKNFTRDVKKHISDIGTKYIRPDEGTLDLALMYVPSEPIYYRMLEMGLPDYANENRVLIVSPQSMYFYLHIVLSALEGEEIEKKAQNVISRIKGVQKDAERFSVVLSRLDKHLTNAKGSMSEVSSGYDSLKASLDSINK